MNATKIPAYRLDLLVPLVDGKDRVSICFSTANELKAAGVISDFFGTCAGYQAAVIHPENLTDLGRELATERAKVRAIRRAKRNRNDRERSQAMRDLGMTRTPYGWE